MGSVTLGDVLGSDPHLVTGRGLGPATHLPGALGFLSPRLWDDDTLTRGLGTDL